MARERTGHLNSCAEAKKMKLLIFHSYSCLRLNEGTALLKLEFTWLLLESCA